MQLFQLISAEDTMRNWGELINMEWKDYEDFMQKYGPKANPKAWYSMGAVGAFYEGIGVLVYRGLIDIDLVAELMARRITMYWEKISPISLEMGKRMNQPVDMRLEYLYNEVKPLFDKYRSELNIK
jgi:hypothetical protein